MQHRGDVVPGQGERPSCSLTHRPCHVAGCRIHRADAYLGNDVWVVGVDAGVVEADCGGLDGATIQLQRAEVEGDSWVGLCVLQRVQPGPVGCAVEDKVALYYAMQDEA